MPRPEASSSTRSEILQLSGQNHPLRVSTHVPSAATAKSQSQSLPWPNRTSGPQSVNVNQNLGFRGGFRPIVLPKFVSNRHEIRANYGYQEAHIIYDDMRQFFARKASSAHGNEVVVLKVTMMSLKPGYKNPQIVSV